jgi:hypothetical protein
MSLVSQVKTIPTTLVSGIDQSEVVLHQMVSFLPGFLNSRN